MRATINITTKNKQNT